MNKLIVGVIIVILLAWAGLHLYLSTGTVHRKIAEYVGYSTMCVEGVEYIQFISGASVAYTPDGKVKACK